MKIAIVGSREYPLPGLVRLFVDALPFDTTIVSGGAKGVDSIAISRAKWRDMGYQEFHPDWDQFGKKAGFLRNKQIVDASDAVVAFWHENSKGTHSTIRLSAESSKPTLIFYSCGCCFTGYHVEQGVYDQWDVWLQAQPTEGKTLTKKFCKQ